MLTYLDVGNAVGGVTDTAGKTVGDVGKGVGDTTKGKSTLFPSSSMLWKLPW